MACVLGRNVQCVRTDRYKYIHWVNRGRSDELDELYDLERDPYEIVNLAKRQAHARLRASLKRELRRLAVDALGL